MKNYSSNKEKRKKIFFIKGMCMVMVLMMGLIILYTYGLNYIETTESNTIYTLKKERFDHIYTYMLDLQEKAYENANNESLKIESYLRNVGDIDNLKTDMDNGTFYKSTLHELFESSMQDNNFNGINNSRNGIIIASVDGILEDSNYKRVSGKESRDWDNEINNSYNGELDSIAINDIINQSNSLIITESVNLLNKGNLNYDNHILIKNSSYESLLEVYEKEGIIGLRNYQIWAPAYITDTGDIFGQDDIVNGIRVKNYKIILIQEFNLYDQIQKHHPELMDVSDINEISNEFKNGLSLLYLMGICYVCVIVVVMIYFSAQYNNYIQIYDLENNKYTSNDNT